MIDCDMLNCEHEIWLWINVWLILDVKNTCVVSCEFYNNPNSVYLEKSVYARCVKMKV